MSAPPEGRMSRLTAFLQSGTGLITAVAALIAAIVGLATLVTQIGGGDDKPSSAQGGVTTVVGNDTPSQQELRAAIRAPIRPTCGPPKDPEENAVAAFNCTYRVIVNLQYNLFASKADLQRGIERVKLDTAAAATNAAPSPCFASCATARRRRSRA